MTEEDFPDQDCVVLLPRFAYTPKPAINYDQDSEEEYTPYKSKSGKTTKLLGPKSARMSRNPRKRTSIEEDVHVQHNGLKKNTSVVGPKKVKFGVVYEYDIDQLEFCDLDPEKYTFSHALVPPTFSDATSDHCLFPLNKSQSKKISLDNYAVLLRLTYFTKQNEKYEDIFDQGMEIKINDVNLPLIQPTPDDANAPLDGPADITRYLVADGNTIERVKISIDGSPKGHIFSIVFAKKKKDEIPFVTLRYSVPNQTYKLVMRESEKLNWDRNKIYRKIYPLTDPVSAQRIEIPVRGQKCTHVEVFDKDTFLRSNRRKVYWKCPICLLTIKDDQLVVDGLITKILACTFSSCFSVELDSYGGWSPIYNEKVFRTRLVDLDNDKSDGEDDESLPEEPLGPESPVDVPPQPEPLPDEHFERIQNGNCENMETEITEVRQVETQTQTNSEDGDMVCHDEHEQTGDGD